MKKILVIEDDPAISKGLRDSLETEHYEVLTAMDGEEGFRQAMENTPDLILLDLMLPSMNGQDICKALREENIIIPILMLTSKKDELDKVLCLEMGADDYITKPFSLRELHARIRAHLRRSEQSGQRQACDSYAFGSVVLDFKKQKASRDGQSIRLSSKEYEIMHFFIQHEDEVISRDMLLDQVWGYEAYPTTRTVDNYILNLRKKIEDDPGDPKHLLTLHKAGYKFIAQPEEIKS
jgi:DNA-binding response OmpR family regulator